MCTCLGEGGIGWLSYKHCVSLMVRFTTWGIVNGRENLRDLDTTEVLNTSAQSLDRNHTHFFLVDDGSVVSKMK